MSNHTIYSIIVKRVLWLCALENLSLLQLDICAVIYCGVKNMKEIAVICPIDAIYDSAGEIVKKHNYSNVEVLMGNMSEGVTVAGKAIAAGAKIIVSRGGTYKMICEAYSIPATEIKVDAYDIVKSYEHIKEDVAEIGIVGYSNIIYGFEVIKKLIPQKIHMIELQSEIGVYDIILSNKQKGIYNYIGDANIIPIVKKLDCKGVVIQSRSDSILSAIQEARRILRATKEEKERTQWILTMTDFIHDGVIAIDREEHVTVFNRRAEKILECSKNAVLGQKIESIIEDSNLPNLLRGGKAQLSQLTKVNDTEVSINELPIVVDNEIVGAVATLQEITELQKLERKIRRELNEKGFTAGYTFDNIVHKSSTMAQCIGIAKKYAKFDTPIHICGDSGVGKELFCQSIHNASARSEGPFVAINCAAISPSLIESEFFGYAEGSFTGASKKGRAGIFELAHEGTLFLDEINELPYELQSRLLRVLQEKQVLRVGGSKMIPVDVRIITASNQYLRKMVEEKKFRKDLYFRINILTLRIPPLSRRKEDILLLAELFINKYASKYNMPALKITDDIANILINHKYSGNVRELENMMEKSIILSSFESLQNEQSQAGTPAMCLKEAEIALIKQALKDFDGNVQKAAESLGISRSTIWRKLKNQ